MNLLCTFGRTMLIIINITLCLTNIKSVPLWFLESHERVEFFFKDKIVAETENLSGDLGVGIATTVI